MTQPLITLTSPAKLNLMLHIIGRRADGYHQLQTVFQFLDYGDSMQFKLRTDHQLLLHDSLPGVLPEQNLILRAAHLLQQHSNAQQGAEIWLNKQLPMGGGVGGGSSNAATTLLALNQLWQCQLPLTELAQLGLQLGADVPVFIQGQACFAEGVGEQMTPLVLPEPWFLVVTPKVCISTAEVFSAPELTRDSQPITIRTVLEQGHRNDCQAVVEKLYPEVHEALNLLGRVCQAKLTGTGSCVFGSFPSQAAAESAARTLPNSLPYFIAKGANTSVTHRQLNKLKELG